MKESRQDSTPAERLEMAGSGFGDIFRINTWGESHGKGIGAKFDAFGWEVIEVIDGNDVEQILEAVRKAFTVNGKPTMIILNTVKGKGIDFAETSGEHSSTLNSQKWAEVLEEAERKYAELREALQ